MPRVTITIPDYNAAATIAETLESLLAQTFRDTEIIVSDNHSTDRTREVVEGFAARGVRLVACPEAPSRTGSPLDNCLSAIQNWNSLVDLGTGEYVGIYHSDDVYAPELVDRQVKALDRRPGSSGAFATVVEVDPEGRLLRPEAAKAAGEATEAWFGQLDLVRRMLQVGHNLSSSGPLLRRSAWRGAGRFDAHAFEQAVDTDFWIRLAGQGPLVVLQPPMVRYRVHPGQDTARQFGLYRHRPMPFVRVMEHWAARPEILPRLEKRDLDRLATARSIEYLRIAQAFCVDGRPKEARAALRKLPGLGPAMALALAEEPGRRHLAIARLLAARVLSVALVLGVARPVSAAIARARPNLRDWT